MTQFMRKALLVTSLILFAGFGRANGPLLWSKYGIMQAHTEPSELEVQELLEMDRLTTVTCNYYQIPIAVINQLAAAFSRWASIKAHLESSISLPRQEELENLLGKYTDRLDVQPAVDLLQISLHVDPNDSDDDNYKRNLGNEIMFRLQAGESFRSLAEQYSDAVQSSLQGGSVGTVSKGTLNSDLESVIFSLGVNETTGPVKSANGYHIFRVTKLRPGLQTKQQKLDAVKKIIVRDQFADRYADLVTKQRLKLPDLSSQCCLTSESIWFKVDNISFLCGLDEAYLLFWGFRPEEFKSSDAQQATSELLDVLAVSTLSSGTLNQSDLVLLENLYRGKFIRELYWRMRYDQIQPSDVQLQAFLKNNINKFKDEPEYNGEILRIIALSNEQMKMLTIDDRKKIIQKVRAELTETLGKVDNFSEIAISGTTTTVQNLYLTRPSGPEEYILLKRSPIGKVGTPMETRTGFMVAKITSVKESHVSLELIKDRVRDAYRMNQIKLEQMNFPAK